MDSLLPPEGYLTGALVIYICLPCSWEHHKVWFACLLAERQHPPREAALPGGLGLCWVHLIPFCICEHAAVAYVAGLGGLGKQVHCLAMPCCDLAMDERVFALILPADDLEYL